MKKKPEEALDTNPFDALFHKLTPERKERPEEPSMDEDSAYYDDLTAKKRARYEALQKKAKE